MNPQPTLTTERLILRPFALADAPVVQRLAGAIEIAATTLNIPHPYEDGLAEAWIKTHALNFAERTSVTFAIVPQASDISGAALIGAIGLVIKPEHRCAEMGYWVGLPYWGRGYCTEAAKAILRYGFEGLGLHRIYAQHFARNPASGRVMQKIGMAYEGRQREHVRKWDRSEDSELYGILAREWIASAA